MHLLNAVSLATSALQACCSPLICGWNSSPLLWHCGPDSLDLSLYWRMTHSPTGCSSPADCWVVDLWHWSVACQADAHSRHSLGMLPIQPSALSLVNTLMGASLCVEANPQHLGAQQQQCSTIDF